jgi:hypothetical protein
MGEIAEGLINGDFDSVTGEYLGEGGGFPRSRSNYYKKRSRVQAGNNYQSNKSRCWRLMFSGNNTANLSVIQLRLIVEEYAIEELKMQSNIKEQTIYKHILRDEQRFKNWYATKYQHLAKYVNQ